MAHEPRNYQALRDEHARAIDALDKHIEPTETPDRQNGVEEPSPDKSPELEAEPEKGPSRPEDRGTGFPGGPNVGGMEAHQNWANSYNKQLNSEYFAAIGANAEQRDQSQIDNAPTNAEHDAASAELDQNIDGQGRGGNEVQDGRNDPGHEAASNALDQHVEGHETGDKKIEDGRAEPEHDAAMSELDQHIDSAGRGDKGIIDEFRDAARETTDPQIGVEI